MTPLLLTLSGADRHLLKEQAPHDVAKYAGIGGAVLTTSAFAVLSSTFALQMAVDAPWPVALLLGLAWGAAILNLDRWLVAANGRQPRWWQNVLVAIPRVVMALVIGLVMSTPLVLRLFEPELNQELLLMQQEAQAAFEQELQDDPRYAELPVARERIADLQASIAAGLEDDAVLAHPEVAALTTRLDALSAEYDEAERAVACEKDGTCGSGRAGAGPAFAEKVARRDRLAGERAVLSAELTALTERVRVQAADEAAARRVDEQQQLATLQAQVTASEQARAAEIATQQNASQTADGLLARLEALQRISEKNHTLHLAHLVLLSFLTIVESLPVLVKLFLSFGKPTRYEVLVQQQDFDVLERGRRELQYQADVGEIDYARALDKRVRQARVDGGAHHMPFTGGLETPLEAL